MSVRGTHVPEHLRLPIAGVTPPPAEKEGQRLFPTGNFRLYRPVYRDKTPPCNHAGPTGVRHSSFGGGGFDISLSPAWFLVYLALVLLYDFTLEATAGQTVLRSLQWG